MKQLYKTLFKNFVLAFIFALTFAYSGCTNTTSSEDINIDSSVDAIAQTENNLQSTNRPSPENTRTPNLITASPAPLATDDIELVEDTTSDYEPALSGRVIGIDPGHQEHPNYDKELISPTGTATKAKVSSGTYGRFTTISEYVINLQVGLKLKEQLELLGATVIMSRETNSVDISNAERAIMMNDTPVDCWIRIHANGNNDKSINGLFFLVPSVGTMYTTDEDIQQKSLRLANDLITPTINATGAQNLGVVLRDDQTGFSWSSIPVCTIEMGHMTNEMEDNLLVTSDYQDKIVDGLINGFLAYFN